MSSKEIQQVTEEIQRNVRDLHVEHKEGKDGILTVSQGVFVKIPDEKNREWDYNSMADMSLYEAKRHGRNRYHIATDFIQ
jgi:PleD family two-component response regulator